MIDLRDSLNVITAGGNYFWALIISFGICFLGSASIGFPIPFPIVLFYLSRSVIDRFKVGLVFAQLIMNPLFWLEIVGLTVAGGLGAACGELTGYVLGYGAKRLEETKGSESLRHLNGFSKLILKNEKKTALYVFLFALTPLPDDIIFIPIGMRKYPLWKTLIPAWLGKNFTILVYCCWPLFLDAGLIATGLESDPISTIITEAVILIFTITVMYFIFAFDWERYAENREFMREEKGKKKIK